MYFHAEYKESTSNGGSPTGEWVITDVAEGNQLGTEQRVKEKEALITKAGMYFALYD